MLVVGGQLASLLHSMKTRDIVEQAEYDERRIETKKEELIRVNVNGT